VTEDQIKALQFYRTSKLFDEKEKAMIIYAGRITRGLAAIRSGTLEEIQKYCSKEQMVKLTLVICVAKFMN